MNQFDFYKEFYYSDFPNGYNYFILADTNDLANYYQQLKDFYAKNLDKEDTSDINSKENRNFILQIIKDSIYMAKETKPAPPASQVIKEGQDPRPKP